MKGQRNDRAGRPAGGVVTDRGVEESSRRSHSFGVPRESSYGYSTVSVCLRESGTRKHARSHLDRSLGCRIVRVEVKTGRHQRARMAEYGGDGRDRHAGRDQHRPKVMSESDAHRPLAAVLHGRQVCHAHASRTQAGPSTWTQRRRPGSPR